jgi:hypothetical protein
MSAALVLKGCALRVGEVEAKECRVPTIETPQLAVKGWYEGKKSVGGTNLVLLFEEQLIAKIVIEAAKVCPQAGTYTLEGSFAANLEPQNRENHVS